MEQEKQRFCTKCRWEKLLQRCRQSGLIWRQFSTKILNLMCGISEDKHQFGRKHLYTYTVAYTCSYWRCYYTGTQAIIYVIDSTDIHRLSATAKELQAIMQEKELMDTDLLVFANKQDAPNALNASEISEKLGLTEMRNKNWTVISTSAITGEGLAEGLDWLVNSIKSQTNTM
ncbi:ADP-ribosylation factor-like protein 1 [Pneumocystis jirovecii RU7]|uniref:ADP-ribosylation factor n=1 Tax=Pneumocystis jirovecii (strain RU7) TaxID=1408657 RepID=A0A0W4ZJQ9_PNEJ7|nr:ADP-ribosylation factor-like protein 1 [Pneumocystis jirovecii RU7]KTW28615.1 ADP-ribosylation factor-like protein 1 [Pneumocystis jirovecii RU7]